MGLQKLSSFHKQSFVFSMLFGHCSGSFNFFCQQGHHLPCVSFGFAHVTGRQLIHILVEFLQLLFNLLALLEASEGLALSQASEGFWVLPESFEDWPFSRPLETHPQLCPSCQVYYCQPDPAQPGRLPCHFLTHAVRLHPDPLTMDAFFDPLPSQAASKNSSSPAWTLFKALAKAAPCSSVVVPLDQPVIAWLPPLPIFIPSSTFKNW